MLIEIREDVFTGNKFKELNTLIQILTYERHYGLFVEITQVEATNLYIRLDQEDQEILRLSFNRYVQEGLSADIVVSESSQDRFNLREAIRYLNQPVSIILENS